MIALMVKRTGKVLGAYRRKNGVATISIELVSTNQSLQLRKNYSRTLTLTKAKNQPLWTIHSNAMLAKTPNPVKHGEKNIACGAASTFRSRVRSTMTAMQDWRTGRTCGKMKKRPGVVSIRKKGVLVLKVPQLPSTIANGTLGRGKPSGPQQKRSFVAGVAQAAQAAQNAREAARLQANRTLATVTFNSPPGIDLLRKQSPATRLGPTFQRLARNVTSVSGQTWCVETCGLIVTRTTIRARPRGP